MKPKLTRRELAEFLTANGYPISYATLETYHSLGTGPQVAGYFGVRPLDEPETGLRWAQGRYRPISTEPAPELPTAA